MPRPRRASLRCARGWPRSARRRRRGRGSRPPVVAGRSGRRRPVAASGDAGPTTRAGSRRTSRAAPAVSRRRARSHDRFVAAIDDDLDLPTALAVVRETLRADRPADERRWLVLDADASSVWTSIASGTMRTSRAGSGSHRSRRRVAALVERTRRRPGRTRLRRRRCAAGRAGGAWAGRSIDDRRRVDGQAGVG